MSFEREELGADPLKGWKPYAGEIAVVQIDEFRIVRPDERNPNPRIIIERDAMDELPLSMHPGIHGFIAEMFGVSKEDVVQETATMESAPPPGGPVDLRPTEREDGLNHGLIIAVGPGVPELEVGDTTLSISGYGRRVAEAWVLPAGAVVVYKKKEDL